MMQEHQLWLIIKYTAHCDYPFITEVESY